MDKQLHFTLRLLWYAAITWIFGFLAASVLVTPWSYFMGGVFTLLTTVFYINGEVKGLNQAKKRKGMIVEVGLFTSIYWFFIMLSICSLEIAFFYYFNILLFFSDARNWFLFPLVLIMPILYSLILENRKKGKKHRLVYRYKNVVLRGQPSI